ncbi:LuxR family transcriptional regulator [Sphingomonas sp. ID1715]|uniref:helix-turn-helix transcriptional regulator n=1 Tax=Sphingomonas sp. ID1715 TaxID=1656898 RepID=UPI00148850CD|nr:LuxR family transcriptional regulator [Sphingomonas sp. ID1715]NNM77980.1 LuxR family transcriptional regulator [Sphingomonas sp. ID1715]
MKNFALADRIAGLMKEARTELELRLALDEATAEMGFSYFALAQHTPNVKQEGFRLHSYPEAWERFYDEQNLTVSDPVHRASQRTNLGFSWSDISRLISLTAADERMLTLGQARGIGDGFTVPGHVPGEISGSCTFVVETGRAVPALMLPVAHWVGAFAFETARRIWQQRTRPIPVSITLTERQRECVFWMAMGKSDWAISKILKIGSYTVSQHLQTARERLDVDNRTSLAVWSLYHGIISFNDLLKR